MCFFDQKRWRCGFWRWAHFQQQCPKEYQTGETCGLKLIYQVLEDSDKCKLCYDIDKKQRRIDKMIRDIERWRREGNRAATIERAQNDAELVASQLHEMSSQHSYKVLIGSDSGYSSWQSKSGSEKTWDFPAPPPRIEDQDSHPPHHPAQQVAIGESNLSQGKPESLPRVDMLHHEIEVHVLDASRESNANHTAFFHHLLRTIAARELNRKWPAYELLDAHARVTYPDNMTSSGSADVSSESETSDSDCMSKESWAVSTVHPNPRAWALRELLSIAMKSSVLSVILNLAKEKCQWPTEAVDGSSSGQQWTGSSHHSVVGDGSQSRGNAANTNRGKRARKGGEGDDERDSEDFGGQKGPEPPSTGSTTNEDPRRLACLFYKSDKEKYMDRQACSGPGWRSVHRVK